MSELNKENNNSSTYLLGISSYSHESSCALIKNGKIISLIEEERLNREKHTSQFPFLSIQEMMKKENISFDNIQGVTFFLDPSLEIRGNLKHFVQYLPKSLHLLFAKSGGGDASVLKRVVQMSSVGNEIKKHFNLNKKPKVFYIEHHLAHAASAFFASPFSDSAILTIDGRGESTSTLMSVGNNNKIRKVKSFHVPHSLGHFYASITDYLGFRAFYDEWKVMGLSGYGNSEFIKKFDEILILEPEGGYRLNLNYFSFHTDGSANWLSKKFYQEFGPARKATEPITSKHHNIAKALQASIEKVGVHLANSLYDHTKVPNLCMAGGVVLNCLMNSAIIRETKFKDFFIQPIANDAGTSLGSALYHYHVTLGQPRVGGFETIYLGPEYSDEQIEEEINRHLLKYQKSSSITQDVAALLAQGKIVGWFQGAMEGGPRALGNRSILADPRLPEMKEKLNKRVKHREEFRPFAPSVLEEKASIYFELPKGINSPYMILSAKVIAEKKEVIPAVVHVDGTARVQTVSQQQNRKYWELISEFEKLTGIPVLLNTSFNENEPIVCSPKEAIDCYLRNDFDVLAIGNFILCKKN